SEVERNNAAFAITRLASSGATCPRYSTFGRARRVSAIFSPYLGAAAVGPPQTIKLVSGALQTISMSKSGRLDIQNIATQATYCRRSECGFINLDSVVMLGTRHAFARNRAGKERSCFSC